jgi:hypothetical protein
MDEIDTYIGNDDRLRNIIDAGFEPDDPAWICLGDNNDPTPFDVFTPMVLAGLGKVHPTIADRCIPIELERKLASVKVARLRRRDAAPLEVLAQKCARWAADNTQYLANAEPTIPLIDNDRGSDAWELLFAIADQVGGHWPERVKRSFLKIMAGETDDTESTGEMLLGDIRNVFEEALQPTEQRSQQRISSAELALRLRNTEGSPWPEFGRNATGLTVNQLAVLLRPFHLRPETLRIGRVERLKGYRRQTFEPVFARYLPPLAAKPTPSSPQGAAGGYPSRDPVTNGSDPSVLSAFPTVTKDSCHGSKTAEKPSNSAECHEVTGVGPPKGGVAEKVLPNGEDRPRRRNSLLVRDRVLATWREHQDWSHIRIGKECAVTAARVRRIIAEAKKNGGDIEHT